MESFRSGLTASADIQGSLYLPACNLVGDIFLGVIAIDWIKNAHQIVATVIEIE